MFALETPSEYRDREQTYFKHLVLKHYLRSWSQKLSSISQRGHAVRLWYVDCFAGPWESRTQDRGDTSVAIGLSALQEALDTWAESSGRVEAGAVFVEADPTSARALRAYVDGASQGRVVPHVFDGRFEDRVADIASLIGADAAFVFVDPTGWKGAGMANIAPLVTSPFRDVMVNVMFHHINRWKYDPRDFLRSQMREFFGLGDSDLPPDLDEEGLMALYRGQLAQWGHLDHVGDLAVPHPTIDRTFFRLVAGGHHPEVLRLFRAIEEKVVGRDAGVVREKIKARARVARTGQAELDLGVAAMDVRYRRMRDRDITHAMRIVRERVTAEGPLPFRAIWPGILADHHVTHKSLADAVRAEVTGGKLSVIGMGEKERSIKDEHVIGPPA